MTVQEILVAALVRNRKSNEDALVTSEGGEAVDAVNRAVAGYFIIAARANPAFFGATGEESPSSGAWARPSDAELVYHIETAGGSEVIVVDPREPRADPFRPSVVGWGEEYRVVENTGRESDDGWEEQPLTFWYSRRPTQASSLSSSVDLDDRFRGLLVSDLAGWIAHRDSRWDELQVLVQERDQWVERFLHSVQHETPFVVRHTGHHGTFAGPRLEDVRPLLLAQGG